jgi:hypothetical protein
MTELREVLNRYAAWGEPHPVGDDNTALGNRLGLPASAEEIAAAWPDGVDPQAAELWRAVGTADLFIDVEYGQWGLHLLSPLESARRTAAEHEARPDDYAEGDIVLGEFLGDQELLVLSPGDGGTLVALPLDKRDQWYSAAPTLVGFLARYYEAHGDKFWE